MMRRDGAKTAPETENAYFAGGCFWCTVPVFASLPGVRAVVSGYSGGGEANPTYAEVKAQTTGHRESVCVEYDREEISFAELVDRFLAHVDPFDGDGQFIDRGRSYTLAIYYASPEQERTAKEKIRALERDADGKHVCIALEPFRGFWPAEEEHQDFYRKHPETFEQELIASGRKKA